MGAGVWYLRSAVARLLWFALQPGRGLAAIPAGWFGPRRTEPAVISADPEDLPALAAAEAGLQGVVAGRAEPLAGWVRERAAGRSHPFEVASREADLEYLLESCSS